MKYYQILPKNLTVEGFQYHEGVNIIPDDIIWELNKQHEDYDGPHGNYDENYEYYFSDAEHILAYCCCGDLIAEVEVPEDATLYDYNDKKIADTIILKNIKPLWNLDVFDQLVQEGADIRENEYAALRYASKNGYSDIVQYLVEQGPNVHECYETALGISVANNHLDVAKCLIEHGANIHARNDFALCKASSCGYLDIVEYLIDQGADVHARDDQAIRLAKTPEIKVLLETYSEDIDLFNKIGSVFRKTTAMYEQIFSQRQDIAESVKAFLETHPEFPEDQIQLRNELFLTCDGYVAILGDDSRFHDEKDYDTEIDEVKETDDPDTSDEMDR